MENQTDNIEIKEEHPMTSLDTLSAVIRELKDSLAEKQETLTKAQQEVDAAQEALKDVQEDFEKSVMEACGVSVSVAAEVVEITGDADVPSDDQKVNDWENWEVGDKVKCLVNKSGYFNEGEEYEVIEFCGGLDNEPVHLCNGYNIEIVTGDKFIKVS